MSQKEQTSFEASALATVPHLGAMMMGDSSSTSDGSSSDRSDAGGAAGILFFFAAPKTPFLGESGRSGFGQ